MLRVCAGFSETGLDWGAARSAAGVLDGRRGADTHNNLFHLGSQRYGAITRLDVPDNNTRRVGLSTTTDFVDYTRAVDVLHGTAGNQSYDMQVVPWGNVYIGLVAVYSTDKGAEGKVFNELAVSETGSEWEWLLPGTPFITHGPSGSL